MIDVATLFPGAAESIYLNTASMALGNKPAADALVRSAGEWTRGEFSWPSGERAGEDLRATAARLLGARREDVALTAGAAGGAATVAAQLGEPEPGANVVVPERDFVSNFLAWALLGDRGYEVRMVPDSEGGLSMDAFAQFVDAGTSVVATSLVQSASGYRVDVAGLKELAAENGAWLVFDASQAFGAIDIDVEGITALFSCSHKWSLGTRGIGYLYVDPDVSPGFRPILPGWKSIAEPMTTFYGPDIELVDTAARLDVSWPWFNPIADLEGLKIIEGLTVPVIEDHNRSLVEALVDGGCVVPFDAEDRSSIVSLAVADTEAALHQMRELQMVASLRAGRLRISLHLYNTLDDVEAVLAVLS